MELQTGINKLREVAGDHLQVVEACMIQRDREGAMAAVDRAFAAWTTHQRPVGLDDPISQVTSPPIAAILRGGGVRTIGQLCRHSRTDLASTFQIRYRSIDLINRNLRRHGFTLDKGG